MKNLKTQFPVTVSSRITDEQKERIEKLAHKLHLTKSEFLRDLITNILINLS